MRQRTVCLGILLFAITGLASVQSARPTIADDVPVWLKQAAAATVPTYEKDVPAVVLYDESIVTVSGDGRIHTVNSFAIRILRSEGRQFARAVEEYNIGASGKVLDMKAWLIRPGGSVRKYGKDDALDRAASDALYSDTRTRTISADETADTGMVFGYETTTEERPYFSQTIWPFQNRLPSLVSRLTMTLPVGWKASGKVLNTSSFDPKLTGTTYTWEMRNMAPIAPEPAGPSISTLAPRLAVSYAPSSPAAASSSRSFTGWLDVSEWYSGLSDMQSEPDEAITQKARELTAKATTELEKIQTIGRYVQNIHYVSIQIGIGGYKPHTAREVFAKQYGDCKDKANLMRAMLRAVDIDSFLVLVYSGDPTEVREEWPTPAQFNHCIIAVKLGNTATATSSLQHAALGRLLIFDPTDDATSIGDLPGHEQGSFALIAAGAKGDLIKLPINPPDSNRREREIELSLAANGNLTASIRESTTGQAAAQERGMLKELSRSDYTRLIQEWAGHDAVGAQFTRIEPADNAVDGKFTLDVGFTAERYGQTMQNRLLVFKPLFLSRADTPSFSAATRKSPVILKGGTAVETIHIKFPADFDVDEVPGPVRMNTPFASYSSIFTKEAGGGVITRTLIQQNATIPSENYAEVRTFFGRVRANQDAPIVLARK